MAKRSKARELAMQMLFLVDMNPDVDDDTVLGMIQERIDDEELEKFSWSLFSGTIRHRDELDQQIRNAAKNWSLERMAPTDRNLLRLGAFELYHLDTPNSVVIDEAIKLAKKFGTENSSAFINGILDNLNRETALEPTPQPPSAEELS